MTGQGLRERLGAGRSVAALCVLVGTLLAVVALASRVYQPVSGDDPKREPSAEFFDYFFTAAAILWVLGGVLLVFLMAGQVRGDSRKLRIRLGLQGALFIVGILLLLAFGRDVVAQFREKLGGAQQRAAARTSTSNTTGGDESDRRRPAEFEWPLALAAALGGLVVAGVLLGRRVPRRTGTGSLAEALADALDDTLDDLRREGDPRLAVIAAYARMERLLAAHGVARHAAEAPVEYLERVLLELDADERPVATLTGLYEEAKFSDHEIKSARRDEAIEALVEIRDHLRGDA